MVAAGEPVNAGESVQILDASVGEKRGTISTMQFRKRKRTAWGWIFGLAAVLLLEAGCTMFKEKPAGSFAEATGGEGFERVFWKHVAAANWTEIDHAIAGNYSGVSAGGTLDKAAALDQYRQWQLKDFSIGNLKTEMNGNTIVVTYTITLNGSAGSQPLPSGPQRMMSVWQQQKSGWVEIAHSTSAP
ncbi:MAG TPA: nuclear transport factor 2 family protein [Terriglobales bacterium]|nr:nuclear transport factor 2 family protein [Terriglobales bacterium]